MKLTMLAVLVTVTYGNVSVQENLSAKACAEAICVAKHGESCAVHQAEEKEIEASRAARHLEYLTSHAKEIAACKARNKAQADKVARALTYLTQ